MTGGEIFLLVLGPVLALSAGLIIYGFGAYGPEHRRAVRETVDETVRRVHGPGRS